MDVLLNPAGMNYAPFAGMIEWACFVWDLRTKLDVSFGGMTSATKAPAGGVLIRMATKAEWAEHADLPTANAIALESDGGTLLLWNPSIPPNSPAHGDLVMHELGHALEYFTIFGGGFHSNDPDEIMYPNVAIGNFPVSTADAEGVNASTSLPAVDVPDLTSSILDQDYDLFIPNLKVVTGDSRQVQLDYLGQLDLGDGLKHTWNLVSNVLNEEGGPSDSYAIGNTAYLHSVQSMGQDYLSAQLSIVGSYAQLEGAVLA